MVRKVPKKIIKGKRFSSKKYLNKYSVNPKNILNRYLPKEVKKYSALVKKLSQSNKGGGKKLTKEQSRKLERAIYRRDGLKRSEELITYIHNSIGFTGRESNLLKEGLNLKPTFSKTGLKRLETMAQQLKDNKFSINRRLAKDENFKELKKDYIFVTKNNMVRIIDKSPEFIALDKKINWLKKNVYILDNGQKDGAFGEELKNLINERERLKRKLLKPQERKINTSVRGTPEETWQDNKTLMEAFNFIFKSVKEREFYEENKDFFRATGGGTKENRANPMWVSMVQNIRGSFNSKWNEEKYATILDRYR